MPVLRGQPRIPALTPDQRRDFLQVLTREIQGDGGAPDLIVFEIPLEWQDKFDAILLWDRWKDVPGQERNELIEEAYGDRARSLSLVHGVTYEEAIEQGQLPVRLRPRSAVSESENRNALLSAGGFENRDGTFQLRYPTVGIAEVAKRQLEEKLPGSEWFIQSSESF